MAEAWAAKAAEKPKKKKRKKESTEENEEKAALHLSQGSGGIRMKSVHHTAWLVDVSAWYTTLCVLHIREPLWMGAYTDWGALQTGPTVSLAHQIALVC